MPRYPNSSEDEVVEYSMITFYSAFLIIALLFGLPLAYLILVQTRNLFSGETTIERFGKKRLNKSSRVLLLETPRRKLNVDLDEEMVDENQGWLMNCLGMLCNSRVLSQEEILLKSKEAQQKSQDRSSS